MLDPIISDQRKLNVYAVADTGRNKLARPDNVQTNPRCSVVQISAISVNNINAGSLSQVA